MSIKVHRWLKGCIPAVLGHQNESEQIVTPFRSQTSTIYSIQTVRLLTGVPSWSMISLPPSQRTKHCWCFWDTLYIVLFRLYLGFKFFVTFYLG